MRSEGNRLKAGQILHQFTAQDGTQVILRTLKWEDLDDLLDVINTLIEESAEIEYDTHMTRDAEADWLASTLANFEKDKVLPVVAEVKGKVIASSSISTKGFTCEKHVGNLGILIRSGYRDRGIGTEMMKILMEQARLMNLKVLTLSVFATNKRAIHVYEKVGFKEAGRIRKGIYRKGEYIDRIIMTKDLVED